MLLSPCSSGPLRRVMLPEGIEGWVVTRYADVRTVLSDPRFVRDPARVAQLRAAAGMRLAHGGGRRIGRGSTLLHLDPPELNRIRRSVSPFFTARRTDTYRAMINALAVRLVDKCASAGSADLVEELAIPLTVGVLCNVLGLAQRDYDQFGVWVRAIHRADGSPETGRRIVEAIAAMDRYLEQQVGEIRDAGVLAEIVTRAQVSSASEGGEQELTDDDVIAFGRDLLVGGYDTAANLISGTFALLLVDPSRYKQLCDDPSTVDAVVEEGLRHVTPFPMLQARYAAEPVEFDGTVVAAGEAVVVDIAAANQDPAHFAASDQWCPELTAASHLSFGHGAHHCLGARLARVEAHAALRAVMTGLTDVRLACAPEDLEWELGQTRALKSLPVRFVPRPVVGAGAS